MPRMLHEDLRGWLQFQIQIILPVLYASLLIFDN